MIDKYSGQYTNAQLTINERKMSLLVQIAEKKCKICGIDRYSCSVKVLQFKARGKCINTTERDYSTWALVMLTAKTVRV
ncbi:MAG: hypothetical protein QW508_00605 [Conexivisphaerales archaeon]